MLKEKDFVEIEYTGKTKDEELIFDTTDEKTAKDNNIFNENFPYGPIIVCLGQKQLLPGLEKNIVGKELGSYKIKLGPDDAFGKKSAKLLRLVPRKAFAKDNIMPMPGLQVNVDGYQGTIRSVSGGRIIVDFNHPLASREIIYDVKLNKVVTDPLEQAKAVLKLEFNYKGELEFVEGVLTLKEKVPEEIIKPATERLKELVPAITKVKETKK